jgi:hypothetical protein
MNFLDFLPTIAKVIDKLIPDPQARAQAQLDLLKLQQAGEFKELDADLALKLEQIKVNAIEAQSPDFFRGGWRPFVGWVCGTGLAVQFLVAPVASWAAALLGHAVAFPSLDMGTLLTLLGGLLGLGTMRTAEKFKGVA